MAPFSVGPICRLLSVSSARCLTNRTVSWFPVLATANGACRFRALRSPARFARRFMGRSRLEVLSILIPHRHPTPTNHFPSSSSCISSGSGLADCRAFLSDAPASHHRQRDCETAGPLRSLFEPFRDLLAFLPFPGSAGYRSDLLQSFRPGTRKASPVA